MMPTIGRIVHYVFSDGPNKGQVRPAIITWIHSETVVNLNVFMDASDMKADQSETTYCLPSVPLGEGLIEIGSWHWPEREVEEVSNA